MKTRIVYILSLLLAFGCSSFSRQARSSDVKNEENPKIVLENLEYIDSRAARIAHPLMCVEGGDFPDGRELLFRVDPSSTFVHAVFPNAEESPELLDGKFRLHGYYQNIQNMDRFIHLSPGKDYQYFVVLSWAKEK
ncbi:hypothetical protein P0Y35_11855 [Kiritimatiellaeota bacterium B1221]|nr:hypothetical protein [Kiritimatiellaeota bacterium B1221]